MLSAEDNVLLARTGLGTPMGDFFRRFWMPLLLSPELPERDGPPVRVKIAFPPSARPLPRVHDARAPRLPTN
jgi:hypothetical protein